MMHQGRPNFYLKIKSKGTCVVNFNLFSKLGSMKSICKIMVQDILPEILASLEDNDFSSMKYNMARFGRYSEMLKSSSISEVSEKLEAEVDFYEDSQKEI